MRASMQLTVFAMAALLGSPAGAVTVGQIDDFSDSAEGWFRGGGSAGEPAAPATVAPTGGPDGAGDGFMEVTSTGAGGPGSRLSILNASQWTGDYLAAGVTAIEMDLNNSGTTDLTIRLLFEDRTDPLNIAVTNHGQFVPAGSGWMHARFPITPEDLTAIRGDATAALSGTSFLRLYHSVTLAFEPGLNPAPIAATLGVDNVTAVPEPAAVVLMLAGLGVVAVGARHRCSANSG